MLKGDMTTSLEKMPCTKAASFEDTFVAIVLPVASTALSVKIGMIKGSIFCLEAWRLAKEWTTTPEEIGGGPYIVMGGTI